ncbi:MAG: 4-hydroxybenzoyl-CoA thioesterase [Comamonas sp. SCN 65-56]|uniref:YbgC/FadM family acyl-CoA thioesterase n=1 Tax=Comamonas sp. SCN 65-56 TaxID=1660095 RepID=UPI00086F00B1|nr:YbgC/FadM family acyl-CoA thioesterase [Comamonas sp. SCN 65-56]ODS93916.1 MAG: 4-hydroxybenzoyl-CoA thioesterase [Comamonas sp. SCN 65-56]
MSTPRDFRCHLRLRVRWSEIDQQRIVFNAHYLTYADCAMTEYWRALGLPYEATMHALGGDVYLKKASVEYHASALLDDIIDVGMRCVRIGASSMVFECGIFRTDVPLVSVELVYVFADPATQTKKDVPSALRAVIESFEAGSEMAELRVGSWQELGAAATPLRTAVFVQEQGVAPEVEMDALDRLAVHAVAFNRLGAAVATGRLLPAQDGEARIGRMAVSRTLRGQRWGRLLLEALVRAAQERGDASVLLHAQCHAEGFYQRAGFVAEGDVFDEAGMAHIAMRKMLR